MIDWIIQNKEWIFSGIGAVFLAGIFGWLFKRKHPPAATGSVGSSARFSRNHNPKRRRRYRGRNR